VAGVGAGVARRFGIDPLLARAIIIGLALVTGIGVLLYGLAWAFLPQDDGRIHAQQLLRGDITAGTVGAGACVLLDLGPGFAFRNMFWDGWNWHPGGLFLILGILALVWWLTTGRHRRSGAVPTPGTWTPASGAPGTRSGTPGTWYPGTPGGTEKVPSPGATPTAYPTASSPYQGATMQIPTTSSPRPPVSDPAGPGYGPPPGSTPAPWTPRDVSRPSHVLTMATLGLALVTVGVVALWDRSGRVPGGGLVIALAAALAVVALGVVLAGLFGRRSGGLAPVGILLAIALLIAGLAPDPGEIRAFDGRTWTIYSRADADQHYSQAFGDALIDLDTPELREEADPTDPVVISAAVGVGRLRVRIPQGMAVEVDADVGAGDVTTLRRDGDDPGWDRQENGPSQQETLRYGGSPPAIVVRAKVGLGQVEVDDRASSEVS
jgi:phage shock protein PspC (stress-responsive transcriptional regulator)